MPAGTGRRQARPWQGCSSDGRGNLVSERGWEERGRGRVEMRGGGMKGKGWDGK